MQARTSEDAPKAPNLLLLSRRVALSVAPHCHVQSNDTIWITTAGLKAVAQILPRSPKTKSDLPRGASEELHDLSRLGRFLGNCPSCSSQWFWTEVEQCLRCELSAGTQSGIGAGPLGPSSDSTLFPGTLFPTSDTVCDETASSQELLDRYMCLDSAALRELLRCRDDTIYSMRQKIKHLQQDRRRLMGRLNSKHLNTAKDEESDDEALFQIARKGKRHLTDKGATALAIRRNLSNVSSKDLGSVLLQDLSHQTICRAEVKAAAALVVDAQDFFDLAEEALKESAASANTISVHSFRSDATNSAVWQKSKLLNAQLESVYVLDQQAGQRLAQKGAINLCDSDVHHWKGLADISVVEDGTAAGTHGLLCKSLQGLHCPLWNEPSASPGHTRVFLATSDGGSDQVCFKKIMHAETEHLESVIVWEHTCWQHAAHLIVKTGLILVDSFLESQSRAFGFFSSLAKIVNLWRENARNMYLTWCNLHGSPSASVHARRLPPRCLAGRWGSVANTERALDDAGPSLVVPVLQKVLAKDKIDRHKKRTLANGPDEIRVEEMQQYAERLGRWAQEALVAVSDKLLWSLIGIMRRCHEPLQHHQCALQEKLTDDELAEEGGHVSRMACGKAEEIMAEFDRLIDHPWGGLAESAIEDHEMRASLVEFYILIVLHHAGGYHRRIVAIALRYPCRLLLFVHDDKDIDSKTRRGKALSCT